MISVSKQVRDEALPATYRRLREVESIRYGLWLALTARRVSENIVPPMVGALQERP